MNIGPGSNRNISMDFQVGNKLKELRSAKGFSLRELAERSGLSINTLSLIENGKSSPSVGTLQQLALVLDISMVSFFEPERITKSIVFTSENQRPTYSFGDSLMQNLGSELSSKTVQPFCFTLQPGMGSGAEVCAHTGYEFVYCLSGTLWYQVGMQAFNLHSGDSLVFEAHLPHRWENQSGEPAQFLLLFFPLNENENPIQRHLSLENLKKEINMKIAVITDDGKLISQHFGRAPYYLVLTIEDGKIIHREMRNKMGHNQFHDQPHAESAAGGGHGMDAASHDKHVSMAETIADCETVLCGGMGRGAYESMRLLKIQPVVTTLRDIDEAVEQYIAGLLVDHTDLLH